MITLSRDQVCAVLVGLVSVDGDTREGAAAALADALTAPRPPEPEPAPTWTPTPFRDMLAALLDLDPYATDQEITETAAARHAQAAATRAAARTAAHIGAGPWPHAIGVEKSLEVLGSDGLTREAADHAARVVRQHVAELDRRLASAARRIDLVRGLHLPLHLGPDGGDNDYCCATCTSDRAGTPGPWPCPTIRALEDAT